MRFGESHKNLGYRGRCLRLLAREILDGMAMPELVCLTFSTKPAKEKKSKKSFKELGSFSGGEGDVEQLPPVSGALVSELIYSTEANH